MRISDWSSRRVLFRSLLQEQVADLLDGVRDGLGVDAALGDVRVEERQSRGLVAVVDLRGAVDPHGDRQDLDAVAFDEVLRQVAGRVDDESDAHGPYTVPGDGHHATQTARLRARARRGRRSEERRGGEEGGR